MRFSARGILDDPHVCHCRMCQRGTGNSFAPLVGVPNDRLDRQGEPATLSSSEGVGRGFCHACGTPLFRRRTDGAHTSPMIAAFDAHGTIPLLYEFAVESRLPQLSRLFHVEAYRLDEIMAGERDGIAATSRQFRPDAAG